MPASSAIRIAMIAVSVRCASGIAGLRKIGTRVRHRLDAGHRGAAARERLEQQPHARRLDRRRHRRRRATGSGAPPRDDRLDDADDDHHRQRRDERVRRQHERDAGLPEPAQVDQRDQREDREAQRERVRQQRRERRDQRADAGRDADRDVEDVVDRERRAGEQPEARPEVLLRDGVRAAAVRIRARSSGDTRSRRSRGSRR